MEYRTRKKIILFFFIFSLYSTFYILHSAVLWAAQPKLQSPSKTAVKEEAALFKELANQITGVGLVTAEEKRLMGQTVEKEKSWILRRTMEIIFAGAFDLYRKGRYQESLEVLNRILTLDPGFERARALHSALLSIGDAQTIGAARPQAPKSIREIIREKFYEAVGIYRDGRKVEAVGKFEEVLALEPKHRKARYYVMRINAEIAKEYFERGKFAQTEGRWEEALDSFYTAVSLDAKTYAFLSRQITEIETEVRAKKIQYYLTEALRQLNTSNWSGARSGAKEIFRLDPGNSRAREIINESLERESRHYLARGDAALAKKEFDRSIEEFERAAKLRRHSAEAKKKIELAIARKQQEEELSKKKEEEEKAKKEAEEKAKADAEASQEQEKAKSPLGAPGGAAAPGAGEQQPAAVTEDAKRAAESHYQQAMIFYQSNDLQRALVELSLALKFDPNNQNAYAAKRMIEQKLAK